MKKYQVFFEATATLDKCYTVKANSPKGAIELAYECLDNLGVEDLEVNLESSDYKYIGLIEIEEE